MAIRERLGHLAGRPAWTALAVLILLGGCHLAPGEAEGTRTFDVVGDAAWTECAGVRVVLLDAEGNPQDILFDDSLASLGQLSRLDAGAYRGGRGGLHILGVRSGGGEVCFEQRRTFEDGGTRLRVDTLSDPRIAPRRVTVPESLALEVGMEPEPLAAAVTPAYANGGMRWWVDDPEILALEGLESGRGNPARARPLRAGKATVIAYSLSDPSLSDTLVVRVAVPPPPLVLARPLVILYLRGPSDSLAANVARAFRGEAVEWKSADPSVARVDDHGRIEPVGEGETEVTATLAVSRHADQSVVRVKRDRPRLTVVSKSGAAVNDSLAFAATSIQEYGGLVLFRWDFQGDGTWDDSLTLGDDWGKDTVRLPSVGTRYGREGRVTARFQVRDGEGHTADAEATLEIGNQAPEIISLRADTTVSVGDTVAMPAHARDPDGKLAWVGWDYEGDGRYDDSSLTAVPEARVEFRHAYPSAGIYAAVFRAMDAQGKARTATVAITVAAPAPEGVIPLNPARRRDD